MAVGVAQYLQLEDVPAAQLRRAPSRWRWGMHSYGSTPSALGSWSGRRLRAAQRGSECCNPLGRARAVAVVVGCMHGEFVRWVGLWRRRRQPGPRGGPPLPRLLFTDGAGGSRRERHGERGGGTAVVAEAAVETPGILGTEPGARGDRIGGAPAGSRRNAQRQRGKMPLDRTRWWRRLDEYVAWCTCR